MRRTNYPEMTPGRFRAGTFEQIDKVRDGWRENRSDFIRNAVKNEIERRQAPPPAEPKPERPRRPAPAASVKVSQRKRAVVAKKNKGRK